MSGFMNIFQTIGEDPRTWVVLALFAARAIWSAVALFKCPVAAGLADLSAIGGRPHHPALFPAIMILGIVLAVAGLLRLSHGAPHPALALFLLLLGVYLFTTEPVRRQISIAETKVRAAVGGPGEAVAVGDLRESHIRLVSMEFGIVALLLIGILAL